MKNGKRIIDSIQLVTTNRIDRQKALDVFSSGDMKEAIASLR